MLALPARDITVLAATGTRLLQGMCPLCCLNQTRQHDLPRLARDEAQASLGIYTNGSNRPLLHLMQYR